MPRTEAYVQHALSKNSFFAALTEEQLDEVTAAMAEIRFEAGQTVMKEGDQGNYFYVIESGAFDVLTKQRGSTPVRTHTSGESFGEVALMYNTFRTATVKCKTAGNLWALDSGMFRQLGLGRLQTQLLLAGEAAASHAQDLRRLVG